MKLAYYINEKVSKMKIGVGIITCNRYFLFKECIGSLPDADVIVIVNDGEPYPALSYPSRIANLIQHHTNKGVGRSKNDAFKFLLDAGCTHIFLCEDDIKILNPQIYREYIRVSDYSGIRHLNFAYHGPRNKSQKGIPSPRKIINYSKGVNISLNLNLTGAFSYYTRDVLEQCGLMDPLFKNMVEHVDHTNKIIRKGFHPPFWWFADVADSHRFIDDLDPDLSKTTIHHNQWYSKGLMRIEYGYFWLKNGTLKEESEEEVDRKLSIIKQKYATSTNEY